MSDGKRIRTDGGPAFGHNPFEALTAAGLPDVPASTGPTDAPATESPAPKGARHRGRVDIIRQRAGRGGKTVMVIRGFAGISGAEKEALAHAMRKACGTGGTVKDGQIEIQGGNRDAVARILEEARFRPVFAGGW